MSLHPDFPTSPYAPLLPEQRWFPADEALRATAYEKLLPPLVAKIREEVYAWRVGGYAGASVTSRALMRQWFEKEHLLENADGSLSPFSYYFAQRDVEELAVFNDEAHHIHSPKMAWFKSIQDIHHRMLQKDRRLALQLDVTATPRHDNGAIFVQTVSDYPLVEAIHQNVVKHPVLPDVASRAKLQEHKSAIFTEKFDDYLKLVVEEWRKSYAENEALGKKAILFVMVDDTRNCDEVGGYLQKICPELQGAVLVIHTKNNGEISEAASGKNKDELDTLRKEANEIDTWNSPHKAIVSVLMLKEGWDVRNVTTIVGLRLMG